MTQIAQILVAAGKGARAGGEIPKQYRQIAGKALLRHTLEALSALENKPLKQVVVYAPGHEDLLSSAIKGLEVTVVPGGATRTASVKAGLNALRDTSPDYVMIHDAARPFVNAEILNTLITALASHSAAVPALPLADAIKYIDNDTVGRDANRDRLRRMQTPQAFRYAEIMAIIDALPAEASFTDDIAIAVNAGLSVAMVPGDERNFKVTYPSDFAKAERMMTPATYTAIGSGYDVHRYTDGDGIWLCGILIPAPYTLLGHSDADAGLHAITDAIFGALADGDIGDHFPPSDDTWKDAASDVFLKFAVDRVTKRGGQLQHIDVTLICEKPKIKPHRNAMRTRLSEITGLPLSRISVKATTTEKLGFTGREEGLAAQAVVTVALPE